MNKPITVCHTLLIMMLVAAAADAQDFYFFNGAGGDSLWTNEDNWGNNDGSAFPPGMGYPGESNQADIIIARSRDNGKRAQFVAGDTIIASFITPWGGALPGNDGFDMTGGTINLVSVAENARLEMGSNNDNISIEVNVSGGTITGRFFTLGGIPSCPLAVCPTIDSDAVWNVSGNAVLDFSQGSGTIGFDTDPRTIADSDGTLNMSGDAMLTVDNLTISSTGNGLVTLADNARIILFDDHELEMNAAIDAGFITGPGVTASYDFFSNETVITAEGPTLAADFDNDGDVDGDDFLLWQTGFPTASGATLMDGDADGDGDTDGDDFLIWQTEFPFPGAGSGSRAVPEPATGALAWIVVAVLGPLVRRRRPRLRR